MSTSNIGETGIESSRFSGKTLSELSVVEQMKARKQIELSEKEREIRRIKNRYPPYKVKSMDAAIKESRANIKRFQNAIKKEQETIDELMGLIALCRQRDYELVAAGFDV